MKTPLILLALLMVGTLAAPAGLAGPLDSPQRTNGFLEFHPDMANREMAVDAYRRGKYEIAADLFQRAARYADKGSQAMLAEMYWKGEGVPQDRALAYAWSDLAAERGYPELLAIRENYWRQMDSAEQARAIAEGQAIYARYGDAVAKPRLAALLRRGLEQATGSHIGYISFLAVASPKQKNKGGDHNGVIIEPKDMIGDAVAGDTYYAPKYWNPQAYFALQDVVWNKPARQGTVDVGPLQKVTRPADAGPDGGGPAQTVPRFE